MSVGRRRFLRSAAAAGAGAMVLRPGSWWGRARAQTESKPKLIIFASSSGHLVGPTGRAGYEGWLPSSLHEGNGLAEAAVSAAALPYILEPLERHADQMLAIDGLRGSQGVGPHQQAPVILTGGGIRNDEAPRAAGGDGDFNADSRSIDQAIAEAIGSRVLGLAFRFDGFQRGEGYLSHTSSGNAFIPIQNHVEAHERVFGSVMPEEPGVDTGAERQRRILETLRGDVGRLRARLPRGDHATLDEHLRSIASVEADVMDPAPRVPSCMPPTAPDTFDARADANVPRLLRSYFQTMVHGMACNYTQVGFIQAGNLEGSNKPRWDEFGLSTTFNEHAISHKFMGQDGAGSNGLSQEDAIRLALGVGRTYSSLLAELLDLLETTLEPDGTPMLRNTIVLHVKPMGENHKSDHLFWQMYGGQNLGIRTGRFLRLSRRDGEDHYVNDLHVALARAMGATDITSFGRRGQNRTPLDLT
ncbi:MAG: DUF1552 domain-containing protein [Myxococcota bacterium]